MPLAASAKYICSLKNCTAFSDEIVSPTSTLRGAEDADGLQWKFIRLWFIVSRRGDDEEVLRTDDSGHILKVGAKHLAAIYI